MRLRLVRAVQIGAIALASSGCRVQPPTQTGSDADGSTGATTETTTGATTTGGSFDSESESPPESDTHSESDGESESGGESVEVVTLAYGRSGAQALDLYLPARATGPLPTIVLAHGGLWQGGDKSALGSLCREVVLAGEGDLACASIGYRLSQDLGGLCTGGPDTYEEQLRDFGSAVVLLQNQAAIHGLDPARMFVGGHSAGGHLAHALNLRWAEFTPGCSIDNGCPGAVGAVGFEGIYDITAWDVYDESWWNGAFSCATHKAFGDPPSSPTACIDPQFARPCWDIGSPTYLANHAAELGLAAAGNALVIHSPGDDWVDIAEASAFGNALAAAFADRTVIVSDDGTCAAGGHNELLGEPALVGCLVGFVRSGGTAIESR